MADPLVEAFATPPTAPERWQRGIAGALVGTRAGAEKVMKEIAADDWAISPYRRWLAGLVGGKAGDYNIKLDEAEKEYIELDNKYKQLKKNRGKTIVIEKKGESDRVIANKLVKELTDKQKEMIIKAGGDPKKVAGIPRDLGWAEVEKMSGADAKIINAELGKLSIAPTTIKEKPIQVTDDEIEEADSLMSTARSKYKKLVRRFNEAIPKKTDLENMLKFKMGLDRLDLQREYQKRRRLGPSDLANRRALYNTLMKEIGNIGDAIDTFDVELKGKGVTPKQLGKVGEILGLMKAEAGKIMTETRDFDTAVEEIAMPIYNYLGAMGAGAGLKLGRPKIDDIFGIMATLDKVPLLKYIITTKKRGVVELEKSLGKFTPVKTREQVSAELGITKKPTKEEVIEIQKKLRTATELGGIPIKVK